MVKKMPRYNRLKRERFKSRFMPDKNEFHSFAKKFTIIQNEPGRFFRPRWNNDCGRQLFAPSGRSPNFSRHTNWIEKTWRRGFQAVHHFESIRRGPWIFHN